MVVTDDGISIDVRLVHSPNAFPPMLVTDDGIVTAVIVVPRKARTGS